MVVRVEQTIERIERAVFDYGRQTGLARFFSQKPSPPPVVLLDELATLRSWAKVIAHNRRTSILGRWDHKEEAAHARLEAGLKDAERRRAESAAATQEAVRSLTAHLGPTAAAWDQFTERGLAGPDATGADLRIGSLGVLAPALDGEFKAPATLHFPFAAGLQIDGSGEMRRGGIDLARALALRALGSVPAGRLHFTFVDPVSLGQSVADFMHLGDFDPILVGTRPATVPAEIERRLNDLSMHVENVISKYLRGQFESIEDYNTRAGELAEPYHLLVVFDYPAAFSDQAAQQLLSLVENGQRCGVHAIVVSDSSREQPRDLPLDRLSREMFKLKYDDLGLRLIAPGDVEPLPRTIVPDGGPEITFTADGSASSAAARLILAVGVGSREVGNEVVTLDRALPVLNSLMTARRTDWLPDVPVGLRVDVHDTASWWQGCTARNAMGVLGKSGASDLASLYFSSVDIAGGAIMVGLPRSGKTSSLHSTILTMCMLYGPDELELYLVDAKHGVEFKQYESLPHARMVSINSEREFSVAVLRSLDREIQRRAELMKQDSAGRTNLSEYRSATGDKLPRIVLVMDEFHELFEVDDSPGQVAFQAFSNIVKQGPFAGVHVVVASQTLSGMPAMDRPTLQLLPQRVAFMCNESDADIVMGDSNRGTRLLSKPGEGLFNPLRGEESRNKPFQGVLVPPDERQVIVDGFLTKARQTGWSRRPRVFDGDAAAVRPGVTGTDGKATRLVVPVGEPFTLEPSAAVTLRRTRGANVLMLGDLDDEFVTDLAVRGALHSFLLGAAQARTTVIDYIGDEYGDVDLTAAELATVLGARSVRSRGQSAVLREAATEVTDRLEREVYFAESRLLILFGLQRATTLQPFDPYAESGDGVDAAYLAKILRDGPEVGVHVVAVADSAKALDRRLGPELLPEFEHRLAGSAASPSDLSFVTGSYGDVPALRRYQLLVADQARGRVTRMRGYPPVRKAEVDSLTGGAAHAR